MSVYTNITVDLTCDGCNEDISDVDEVFCETCAKKAESDANEDLEFLQDVLDALKSITVHPPSKLIDRVQDRINDL